MKIKLTDINPNNGFQKLLKEQHPEIYKEDSDKVVDSLKRDNKYNAKKVEYDGILFDSKRECYMYQLLKPFVKEHPEVAIELQTSIILKSESDFNIVVYKNGVTVEEWGKIRAITYRADFVLCKENHPIMFIDVKGLQLEVSRIKMKLLRHLYPGVPIILPTTNKQCDEVFEMLNAGIFAQLDFKSKKKKE